MAELIFDTRTLEPWMIAAQLDTILAYPDAKPQRLIAVATALCADQIGVTTKAYPGLRPGLASQYPAFNPSSNRTSTLTMNKRRLNAQRAGAVFLAMIQETVAGAPPTLHGQPVRPTLDFLVAYYWRDEVTSNDADDHFSSKIHSIEQREVRARYPVAHLCAALQWLAMKRADEGGDDKYDYQDLDFLREWVSLAQQIHRHIQQTPSCASIASVLIDLRWIE